MKPRNLSGSTERISKPSKRTTAVVDEYFRIRDFEYVQPLYDLAFLLEVGALAKKAEIPKYRTFSLWRAGYSLDGYGTTIDRWLDGTIGDDGLDYVPSLRIREYLNRVRKTGTLPELKSYREDRFARSLRLRAVRGLGPSQIALSLLLTSTPEEWLNQFNKGVPSHRARVMELFNGRFNGPWQSAHIVSPVLRFLRAIERTTGGSILWGIAGIQDPFEPVTSDLIFSGNVDWPVMQAGIDRVLKKERFFRKNTINEDIITIQHQMGWMFAVRSSPHRTDGRGIKELVEFLDPLAASLSNKIVADLHLHTAWSDGSASVNTMATAVVASGLQYFAVTDHSRSSKLQGGLTPPLWLRQANALTLAAPVCPVLHGIEVDILKDGSLDLPISLLTAADLVVASVHSSWSDDIRENTARLVKAIESGCVDIVAHPTSAVIGKPGVPDYLRPAAEVDWDTVFKICAQWRVALEFNCFPSRLDLSLPLLNQAIAAGCAISLGSDAHARSHLLNLRFGEAALRRLNAPVVLNSLSYVELKTWIEESRAHRKAITRTTATCHQPELFSESKAERDEIQLIARIQPPQRIPSGSRVVGIDLTAGDKATGVSVLDGFEVVTSSLTTDEQILDFVREHKPKIVSIDSPLGLPGGGVTIDPEAGIMRVAEYDLQSVGIPAYPSLIDSMEKLTLRGIRLRREIEAFSAAPRVIESYPGAAQDILCIPRKQKSLNLLREGLRRLGLQGVGLDTQSHDEMDAITSAIVGRYYEAGLFEPMGIPSEAQLIVPKVSPLTFDQNPIVCLAGKTGAGKSVVARYLSVFYGFTWIRTREVIRDLLIEDSALADGKRLFHRKVDPAAIKEEDLREFGLLILDVYKQIPLRKHLMKMVMRCSTPVVVDSVRDVADVQKDALGERPALIWFVDSTDSIIRNRLAGTKKMGEKRLKTGSPVDRTAADLRRAANRILVNSSSLEDLRWAVDDALFSMLQLRK